MIRYLGRTLFTLGGLAVALALAASPAAAAGIPNAVANQPAATLLLPYFEVDLGTPDSTCTRCRTPERGINTIFTINNASATAILAYVTVWSDLSVPVLAFSVYLTGFDSQVIDMREVIEGRLPRTASVGQDPGNLVSPKGPLSQDINFASCGGILPYPAQIDTVAPGTTTHVKNSLTGQPSAFYNNQCSGQSFGDNHARGYVTVDTVNSCSLFLPSDGAFYFSSITTTQNVLWGDYAFVDAIRGATSGGPLVHILANATDPVTSTPGNYTFYGRYVGWSAADKRQPLATTFAARYQRESPFTGTSLIVWRDSKVNQSPFTCPATPGVRPAWYPLSQEQIVVFDEQENPLSTPSSPVSPPPPQTSPLPFPAETQLVAVGDSELATPFASGWLYLNLNTTVAAAGANPPIDPSAAQAWVIAIHTTNGPFGGITVPGIQLDNASKPTTIIIPVP